MTGKFFKVSMLIVAFSLVAGVGLAAKSANAQAFGNDIIYGSSLRVASSSCYDRCDNDRWGRNCGKFNRFNRCDRWDRDRCDRWDRDRCDRWDRDRCDRGDRWNRFGMSNFARFNRCGCR